MKDSRRKHTNEEHDQIGRREMWIQFHGSAWIFENDAGLLQSDERNEKSDARGNTILQAGAHCVENQLPQSDQRQN